MIWVQAMFGLSRFRLTPLFSPLLCAVLALCACDRQSEPAVENTDGPALNLPAVPTPEPALDRGALLAVVAEAASAAAAGVRAPESLQSLDGRQFQLRIRFGCSGPSTELGSQPLGWTFDAKTRRLRIRARPTIIADDPLALQIGGEQFESVEGFWIPRPWLLQALCPASQAVLDSAAELPGEPGMASEDGGPDKSGEEPLPAAPRIGIAQFFKSTDPRTRRRDSRPYETDRTLAEGSAIPSQGFDLVLSGRLRAIPGKRAIECVVKSADSPPECIVSAQFQRVWIEEPASGEVYAEWGGG